MAKANRLFEDYDFVDIEKERVFKTSFKTVSLFSGCGGMDVGFMGDFSIFAKHHKKYFSKNPFEVIWANDIDKDAVESYKLNIGNHIRLLDINDIGNDEI